MLRHRITMSYEAEAENMLYHFYPLITSLLTKMHFSHLAYNDKYLIESFVSLVLIIRDIYDNVLTLLGFVHCEVHKNSFGYDTT